MAVLAERFSRTQLEMTQMRLEREELTGYVRDIDAAMTRTAALTPPQHAQPVRARECGD
jgi:hypothetical protein